MKLEIVLRDDDGLLIGVESVPNVSYEKGSEAVARMVRYYERKEVEKQHVIRNNEHNPL